MAYEWERDEWRSAVRALTLVERENSCGHPYYNDAGHCSVCGQQADV